MSQISYISPVDAEFDNNSPLHNEEEMAQNKPKLPLSLRLIGLGGVMYIAYLAWSMPAEICF